MSVAAAKLTWDDIKDLPEDAGRTEIVNGELVLSPGPASRHQEICILLTLEIGPFIRSRDLGKMFAGPMHTILALHSHYEPDLCFIRKNRLSIIKENFIDGPPDLVVEVISESNRTHDTVVKFNDYARYGIEEYWLVDPREEEISTWFLSGGKYELLGRARRGESVTTRVLDGLDLNPDDVLAEPYA